MARGPQLLSSTTPKILVPAQVHISHVQLRDLIICPSETGIVNYVSHRSILEHNLNVPSLTPKPIAELSFAPNTLAALPLPDSDETLIAAGGQEAEIYLSIQPKPSARARRHWHFEDRIPDASINNSVIFTSFSLARSHYSAVEPRIVISNNDCTVKFLDVPIRAHHPTRLPEVGSLRLNVPVNHSSISPDGSTLLSVGDSSKVHLHHITGGARLSFAPIATLSLPPSDSYSSTSLAASFSTAFSSDGTKYAVASQEGTVAVWDVRSTKPLKVFHTDKTRLPSGNGGASGWLSDDPWEWTRGNSKAPGWSVRNIKFGICGANASGKEVMVFTEHTSLLHIIDARTFETEQIVRVPLPKQDSPQSTPRAQTIHQSIFRHRRPSQTQNQPPNRYITPSSAISHTSTPLRPPGPSYFVSALEDTFRIPTSPSPETVIPRGTWRSGGTEDEDFVLIPPMGDREVEDEVHTLLGHHGIRTRFPDDDYHRTFDYAHGHGSTVFTITEDEMEVEENENEMESDCISSHTPSRSSSPSPPAVHVGVGTRIPPGPGTATRTRRYREVREDIANAISEAELARAENDLDIAGTCFDPSGGSIYVASTSGIAEWCIQGSEKRWWHDIDEWM